MNEAAHTATPTASSALLRDVTLGVFLGTAVASALEALRVLALGDGVAASHAALGATASLGAVAWTVTIVAAIAGRRIRWPDARAWVVRTAPLAAGAGVFVFGAMLAMRSLLKHPALGALLAGALAVLAVGCLRAPGAWLAARVEASAAWRSRPNLVTACVGLGSAGAFLGALALQEQVRSAVPWGVVFCGGAGALAAVFVGMKGYLRGRIAGLAIAAAALVVLLAGALGTGSPLGRASDGPTPSGIGAGLLRAVTDWDGDGVGAVFGDADCAPFDAAVNPNAVDIPGNGVDDNCSGSDARPWVAPVVEETVSMPPALADANVLFITVDTLRYDHTGFGGYTRPTTPNLDALAAVSLVFDNVQADAPATVGAFSAMWTARPFYSQAGCAGDSYPPAGGWHNCKIHPAENTLPERLRGVGMKTSAVVSHNYFTGWGLEQGFDSWTPAYPPSRDLDLVSSEGVTVLAIKELERLRNDRFFLWVHYFDPHGRYLNHGDVPVFGETAIDRYDAEIAHTDRFIGVLLKALSAMGLGPRTIVAVASDHGEEFASEHGGSDHTWAVYDTSTRVPWILHLPGVGAGRVPTAVAQMDIGPTLVAAAGGTWAPTDREGLNLFPGLLAGALPARPVFSHVHHPEPVGAVSFEGRKLVRRLRSGEVELFDPAADVRNLVDLSASSDAADLLELHDAWRAHVEKMGVEHRRKLKLEAGP